MQPNMQSRLAPHPGVITSALENSRLDGGMGDVAYARDEALQGVPMSPLQGTSKETDPSQSFLAQFQNLMGQSMGGHQTRQVRVPPPAGMRQAPQNVRSLSDREAPLPEAEGVGLAEQLLAMVREALKDARWTLKGPVDPETTALEMACSQEVFALDTLLHDRPSFMSGVHVLAGPSGVGKSTLAAHLAQWGVEAFGAEQVVLISYQDERVGAWKQAQLLGAQAGVPVLRALDVDALGRLLEEVGHRALVLIDTPGARMAQNVAQIMALRPQAQVHAVLAADASWGCCRRVLQDSGIAFAGLVLSKLEEVNVPPALLQALPSAPLQWVYAPGAQHWTHRTSAQG